MNNIKIIGLRAGHSDNCIGAVGILNEHEEMKKLYILVKTGLESQGFTVIDCNSNGYDANSELSEGTNKSNSANVDLFISLHMNASNGQGHGTETWVHSGSSVSTIAQSITNNLASLGFYNRGVKTNDGYYEMKYVNAPNIIIETAFCDSQEDVDIINSIGWQAVANQIIKGISGSLPTVTEIYRVRTAWDNITGQLIETSDLILAKKYADSNSGYVVYDSKFNVVYAPIIKANVPITNPIINGITIMGVNILSVDQMVQYLLIKNPNPKLDGIDIKDFCQAYLDISKTESIRGDIAFAQSCHETGNFAFGGQVLPEQHNYAGIGATNNSATGKGAWFIDYRQGILAQIQHLKAYGSKDNLVNSCVDPRFSLVTRGIASLWTDLGGKWAVPGYDSKKYTNYQEAFNNNDTYGQKVLKIYDEISKVVITKEVTYDMDKIVIYYGDADIFPAIPVSQKFACPLMSKTDYEASGLKVKEVIQIGGKPNSTKISTIKDACALL